MIFCYSNLSYRNTETIELFLTKILFLLLLKKCNFPEFLIAGNLVYLYKWNLIPQSLLTFYLK